MSQKSLVVVLAGVVIFQAGMLIGQLRPFDAHAEPGEGPGSAASEVEVTGFYDPPRLYCKPFRLPLEGARAAFETNDRTTAIGKWIASEEESYELFSIDFEVGQKPTGYPVGIAYVCLSPR